MKHSIYNKILIGYIIFAALSLISINTFISSKVMDTETRPRSFTTRQMPQVHITAIIIIMYMTLSSTTMKGM